MRVLSCTIVLCLSGCAAVSPAKYCAVHFLQPDAAAPLGLVQLASPVAEQLREQLPAKVRSQYVCWYVAGRELVVTNPSNSSLTILGYTFVQQGGGWVLSAKRPHIVALPKAIQ
jgi:hypothetical protein